MTEEFLDHLLNRIVELTAIKKTFWEDILRITSCQSGLLAPEKTGELLSVIRSKQNCIDKIKQVDAEIPVLEKKVLNYTGILSWEEGKEIFKEKWEIIKSLRNEVILLVQKTQKLDEQNRINLAKEYKKLKRDIETLKARKGPIKAYRRLDKFSTSYFIDKKK